MSTVIILFFFITWNLPPGFFNLSTPGQAPHIRSHSERPLKEISNKASLSGKTQQEDPTD
jgi:hypothetical protein